MKKIFIMALAATLATLYATAQNQRHAIAGPNNDWTIMHDGPRATCPICHPQQKPAAPSRQASTSVSPSPSATTQAADTTRRWEAEEAARIAQQKRNKAVADSLQKLDPSKVAYHGKFHYRDLGGGRSEVWVWDEKLKRYRKDSAEAKAINKRREQNRRRVEANHQRNVQRNRRARSRNAK